MDNHPGDLSMHDDELDLICESLDRQAKALTGNGSDKDFLEMLANLCYSELDSRWAEFPEGLLEDCLRKHLEIWQIRLGIDLE